MAVTAATHLPPLGSHQRQEVGRELQATLVELIDLSLVGKQQQLWMIRAQLPADAH